MDEFKKALEEAIKKMESCDEAISKAEGDEAKAVAQKAYDEAYEEQKKAANALEDAIVKAKNKKKADSLLASAGDLTKANVPDGAVLGGAEAKDHDDELRQCEKSFTRYMEGGKKALSGQEADLIIASDSTTFNKGLGGAIVPKSMAIKMFGLKWAKGVGMSDYDIARVMKASTMVTSSNALGGYAIPEDFRANMIDAPVEGSHIMPRATIVPAPTGEVTWPRSKQSDSNEYGGMSGSWVSEAGTKPQSDTQFEQVKIDCNEFAMYTEISQTLIRRSPLAIEQWVGTRGSQVAMDAMDQAFINGDGSGKPLGILQTDGIRTVGRQTSGTVVRKDLTGLKYALKPYHRAGAVYVTADGVLQVLEELEDTNGRPLFTANTNTGLFERLGGYPFVGTTRNPDLGTEGDIFFCDLREYYVAMDQDIVIKRSEDYKFQNNVVSLAIFVNVGGELVEPRLCAQLGDVGAS